MLTIKRIPSIVLVVLLLSASLTLNVPLLQAQAPACEQTYVVAQGDDLSRIAERFYGDRKSWRLIYDAANAAAQNDSSFSPIANPNVVVAGQKLCIPAAPAAAAASATPAAPAGALTLEALKNATYAGIYDQPVTLTDGKFQGEPFEPGGAARPTVTFVDGLVAYGDLNGDGVDEAVVLLVENSGGTGSFFYVAVVADQGGQPVNIAMGTLGDRVQVKSMVIGQGLLHTEIITQGPDDAFCCPTMRLRQTFKVQGDQLVETVRQELGTVSYKDLDGSSWQLVETDIGHAALPGSQITARFAGNTVSGSAGCNSYSADVTPGDLQALTIGNAAATLMACADPAMMDQEAQYLKALGGATSWFYLTGQLALNYQAVDAYGSLIFAPAP